jgi:hypothetical protein
LPRAKLAEPLVAIGDFAMEAPDLLVAIGDFAMEAPDLLVADGDFAMEASDVVVADGDFAMEAPDLLVSGGDFLVKAVCFDVACDDLTVQPLDLLVACSHFLMQPVDESRRSVRLGPSDLGIIVKMIDPVVHLEPRVGCWNGGDQDAGCNAGVSVRFGADIENLAGQVLASEVLLGESEQLSCHRLSALSRGDGPRVVAPLRQHVRDPAEPADETGAQ